METLPGTRKVDVPGLVWSYNQDKMDSNSSTPVGLKSLTFHQSPQLARATEFGPLKSWHQNETIEDIPSKSNLIVDQATGSRFLIDSGTNICHTSSFCQKQLAPFAAKNTSGECGYCLEWNRDPMLDPSIMNVIYGFHAKNKVDNIIHSSSKDRASQPCSIPNNTHPLQQCVS